MRWLLAITLLCAPAWAGRWRLVQNPSNTACPASASCTVTLTTPVRAGSLLIANMMKGGSEGATLVIASVSGAGTWNLCPASACRGSDATAGGTDSAYNLSALPGATSITITVTVTMSSGHSADIFEYANDDLKVLPALDGAGNRAQSTAATSILGVPFNLTGNNDVMVQTAIAQGTFSAITGRYTDPVKFPSGNGVAGAINYNAGDAPTWTSTSGRAALNGIAFSESHIMRNAEWRRRHLLKAAVAALRHRVIISGR